MATIEDLRNARLKLIEAETSAKTYEGLYAKVKYEEAERESAMGRASFQEDNTLVFGNVIEDSTVFQAIRTLEMYSRRTPGCAITIILNSPGGAMESGFQLYDYLQELRGRGHHITIKVMGGAYSHAVTILQAADNRIMTENAFLLIHEAQLSGVEGNFTQVYKMGAERAKMYHNKLLDILSSRSNMTKAKIRNKWTNNEWFMTAEEALKHGFIDAIQSPPRQS